MPVKSSISAYLGDIGALQYLHMPFKKSQLKTGTRSMGFKGVLHLGQCEGGMTMDSPSGRRYMTTFKKLPIKSPSIKNTIVKYKSI
jgi:hypothetical protein